MGSWLGRGDLVVLEKDAQMLYGALGVLTELRDIAAERLRPPVQQPMKGIKQNALRDQRAWAVWVTVGASQRTRTRNSGKARCPSVLIRTAR